MHDLNTINNMLAEVYVEENATRAKTTLAPYLLEWSEYELANVATITTSLHK